MDVANMQGGIVIGTGDLSELALGWATYNGDHMSMYGVNCSVPKTLVRHMVEWAASVETNDALRPCAGGCGRNARKSRAAASRRERKHSPEDRGYSRAVRTPRLLPLQLRATGFPALEDTLSGHARLRRTLRPCYRDQVAQDILPPLLCPAVQAFGPCPTVPRWEASHSRPAATGACRQMPRPQSGCANATRWNNTPRKAFPEKASARQKPYPLPPGIK